MYFTIEKSGQGLLYMYVFYNREEWSGYIVRYIREELSGTIVCILQ